MSKRLTSGLLALTTAAGLAGCKPDTDQTDDTCGAAALQDLVGKPEAAFDPEARAGPVRIIPPGSAVTMDYRPERLNLDLDETGAITRVWCG